MPWVVTKVTLIADIWCRFQRLYLLVFDYVSGELPRYFKHSWKQYAAICDSMLHMNIGCISTCGHPSSREKEEVEEEEEREEKWNVEKRRSKEKKCECSFFSHHLRKRVERKRGSSIPIVLLLHGGRENSYDCNYMVTYCSSSVVLQFFNWIRWICLILFLKCRM